MKKLIPLFVFASVLPAQAAADEANAASTAFALARANNAFGCDLHGVLKEQEGNLFYSPYSIMVALGMTQQGAVGATAEEMQKVLHTAGVKLAGFAALEKAIAPNEVFDSGKRPRQRVPAYELHAANALWGQIGMKFEKPFVDSMDSDFHAPFQRIDFTKTEEARKRINDWVEQHTKKRIKDIRAVFGLGKPSSSSSSSASGSSGSSSSSSSGSGSVSAYLRLGILVGATLTKLP